MAFDASFQSYFARPATANAVAASNAAAAKKPEDSPTITLPGFPGYSGISLPAFPGYGRKAAPALAAPVVPAANLPTMPTISPKLYQQADVRKAESGASAPQTPGVSAAEAAAGTAGSTSAGGTGFKATPTSAAGISRVDAAGMSPLFTNLDPGTALDDIKKMRGSPLASATSMLAGVKDGSFGLLAPKAQPEPYVATDLRGRMATMLQEADALSRSGGIVDSWRARGLRRSAMQVGEAATAQESQANAAQANVNQRRGQDMTYALGLANNAATRRGQDMGFLPRMGDVVIGQGVAAAIAKGDIEAARQFATIDKPRVGNAPKFEPLKDAMGNVLGILDGNTGAINYVDVAAESAAQKLKTQQQAAAKAKLEAK